MLLVVLACVVAGVAGAILATRGGSPRDATPPSTAAATRATRTAGRKPRNVRLIEQATGRLAAPVQDAAAVALGRNRAMLLGGLTAADTSRADIRIATPKGDRAAGQLPTGLHDTAAVHIGNAVYVFGGGTAANTQSDAIVRVPAAGGAGSPGRAAAGAELRPVRGCNGRHRLRCGRLHRESLA